MLVIIIFLIRAVRGIGYANSAANIAHPSRELYIVYQTLETVGYGASIVVLFLAVASWQGMSRRQNFLKIAFSYPGPAHGFKICKLLHKPDHDDVSMCQNDIIRCDLLLLLQAGNSQGASTIRGKDIGSALPCSTCHDWRPGHYHSTNSIYKDVRIRRLGGKQRGTKAGACHILGICSCSALLSSSMHSHCSLSAFACLPLQSPCLCLLPKIKAEMQLLGSGSHDRSNVCCARDEQRFWLYGRA